METSGNGDCNTECDDEESCKEGERWDEEDWDPVDEIEMAKMRTQESHQDAAEEAQIERDAIMAQKLQQREVEEADDAP